MTRALNLIKGLSVAADRQPKRLHKKVLPEGGSLSEEEMEYLLQDYYRLRGLSREGQTKSKDLQQSV